MAGIAFNAQKPWNDYASYLRKRFGARVQKISVDAGFTCPNRDGTLSFSGCVYCNNKTFNPFYCSPNKSITQQLAEGIAFFGAKYKTQKYLAYFQAYSNTYNSTEHCMALYEEALSVDGVIGLVIATRPDCVSDELLNEIAHIAQRKYVVIEYGAESTLNTTLELINRCHTYEQTIDAVIRTHRNGIYTGLHLIMGLPGESIADMLGHAEAVSELPLHTVKLHQLQIIRGTKAEDIYRENPNLFTLFGVDEYVRLVARFLARLHPGIMPDRFSGESPRELLLAPDWQGLKNFELLHRIEKYMNANDLKQACSFKKKY